ncbi:AIPR family protein [Acinetobacter sp. YH12251]|uniref:AIPR family protein n=1 Tax=Acinetobacter sp. YH12251 TaxID=2601176 RepID=UPI0015D365A8|nr:AIPR family protein [Acinetobacter sp. YH12251]
MPNPTKINHPIISSYVQNFINLNEIPANIAIDEHLVFEMFLNDLVLETYTNDINASYEEMETGRAIGIDGVAIFVADKHITSIDDFELVTTDLKKFDVDFYFTQAKTSEHFDRQDVNDFLNAVIKFFDIGRDKCLIPELANLWEIVKYIYTKTPKFKKLPKLHLVYASLASTEPDLKKDIHLKADIDLAKSNIIGLNIFDEEELRIEFLGIKQIMALQKKTTSQREIVINMSKTPISYPKHPDNKIENAYFGLLKIDQLIRMISDQVGTKRVLKKGVFDDNIRFYLGSGEKIEVNQGIRDQLLGENYHLFGLLNNGITIICDETRLNSEELTLVNYQIVNGCQTSNVILEFFDSLDDKEDIFVPARFIATEDEDTKNAIIKGTNSQTSLTPAQLMALSTIQKAIEEYYVTKMRNNNFPLYYERRTEQYRDEGIAKTKIINIPTQIKCTSALFCNLPHEVSGQYGKVERSTRGILFRTDTDLSFLNIYYVSGLCWYKVERFVQNNEEGKKVRRARWHIMMLLKLMYCNKNDLDSLCSSRTEIDKKTKSSSEILEKILLQGDDELHPKLLNILDFIKDSLSAHYHKDIDSLLDDRKIFERKETTNILIDAVKKLRANE